MQRRHAMMSGVAILQGRLRKIDNFGDFGLKVPYFDHFLILIVFLALKYSYLACIRIVAIVF